MRLWILLLVCCTGIACGDGLLAGPADSQTWRPDERSYVSVDVPEACHWVTQSGCEADEKCSIVQEQWTCTSAGTRQLGQWCAQDAAGDNCRPGLLCYQSACQALCGGSSPCQTGELCMPIPAQTAHSICLEECNPLAQQCPLSGGGLRQGCYLSSAGSICAPLALGPPTLPGALCSYINQCAIGSGCVQIEDQARCRAYCDYGLSPDQNAPRCGPSGTCRPLLGSAQGQVGYCL